MKKALFILLTLCVLIISITGCDYMKHTPGSRTINEEFALWSMGGEKVALVKLDEKEAATGDVVIEKNFVAYDIKDNILILCEQVDKEDQSFWTFDLQTEKLENSKGYNELCAVLKSEEFDWVSLWIRKFELIKD